MTKAPKGFKFAVASAGFKKPGRKDMALLLSDAPATAAGVFTTNLFKAAPVLVCQEILANAPKAFAVLINTGQANACTGAEGLGNCRRTLELLEKAGGPPARLTLPGSTGVIGAQLKMDLWEKAVPELVAGLGKSTPEDFAAAIMTTDSFPKHKSLELELGGGTITLTGMAKGAGMICPNMATMLAVVLCDAKVAAPDWQAMFRRAADLTFNRVSVDGDTSTNDSLIGLANGASGICAAGPDLPKLEAALTQILGEIAYLLVKDGEGATKVLHIKVSGAKSDHEAELAARTVGHSQLVKTAMYGKDANWGRIVAALGRSGAYFDPDEVSVRLCGVELFIKGRPTTLDFDALLKDSLLERDFPIDISLGSGPGKYTLLASDLTHEYVSINADYRS